MNTGDVLGHIAAEALFSAAPDAWLIVDANGTIVAANALAPTLFGTDDLVGGSVDELLPERLRERHVGLRGAYLADPTPRTMASGLELHGQRVDGSIFPVLVSLSPISVGEHTYVIAALRDDSDAMLIRQELAVARERSVVAEDRDRMARDLHDTVIQELFAIGLGLQGLGSTAESDETKRRIQRSIDDLDRVIRDIRGVIFDLGILPEDQLDLVAELERIMVSERAALRFDPTFEVEGDAAAISESVAVHLRHVVREGLSNVARHAQATACSVRVTVDDTGITVEIADNGSGPSLASTSGSGGRGLGNLGARARLLGGECEFGAREGGGSRLRWTVPYEHEDTDE